jgi:hypothetical protein
MSGPSFSATLRSGWKTDQQMKDWMLRHAVMHDALAQQSSLFPGQLSAIVASLPTPTVPTRAFVTDSTVAASGNFGAIVAGTGTHTVPVYWDGTNWRIG